jgi:hypothetical protein
VAVVAVLAVVLLKAVNQAVQAVAQHEALAQAQELLDKVMQVVLVETELLTTLQAVVVAVLVP